MEYAPPQFFHRGPAPIARLTFFALLSVLLMVLDARFRYAEPMRQLLALAVYPLQQLAIAPVSALAHSREFFATQTRLRRENTELRGEKLKDAEALLALESVREENEQLKRLLAARERLTGDSIFAEIVYAGRDPFSRKVIIDRGGQHGIVQRPPVIDAAGVIGQVTRVQPLLAEVTLVTDKDHAIPVQVVRNGLRGVAYGSGDGTTMELRHMAANAEVEKGDCSRPPASTASTRAGCRSRASFASSGTLRTRSRRSPHSRSPAPISTARCWCSRGSTTRPPGRRTRARRPEGGQEQASAAEDRLG